MRLFTIFLARFLLDLAGAAMVCLVWGVVLAILVGLFFVHAGGR